MPLWGSSGFFRFKRVYSNVSCRRLGRQSGARHATAMLTNPSHQTLGHILILLYCLSGLISLAYEVLWVRMLSLQFGVSIFGVVITVSAFMAGLGVGSLAGRKFNRFSFNSLFIYGVLEGVVALLAIIMPWLLRYGDVALSSVADNGGLGLWYTLQFIAVGLLLFVPATLMGAAFPVILQARNATDVSLAKIYGVNAIGAACGAILPLILLPRFGWMGAIAAVAGVGLFLSLMSMLIAGKLKTLFQLEGSDTRTEGRLPAGRVLWLYAGIGAAALMLEVAWTRLYGMIFLRTEYVLAIILAVFLSGMGAGSVIARRLKGERWLAILPVIASAFSILSLWLLPPLSEWAESSRQMHFMGVLLSQGGMLALVTFPVTLVLGAWLPLLTRHYTANQDEGAVLYGVNSLGAALGAVFAGLLFTPLIGTSATLVLAGLLLLVFGLALSNSRKAWMTVPLLIVFAVPVISMPRVEQLIPQLYHNTKDVYSHEDAISITHVVQQEDGQRVLLTDLQRMDASSDPAAVVAQQNQARLPLLLHPSPGSVLFLGLGTGISAAGSLAFPDLQRTAVELSQGSIEAAKQWFDRVNSHVTDKMRIVRDDARHFLMRDSRHYDVIIGDLFHPDLVGRSALLSVEQFQRAKQHLSGSGVFVQWIALNQFDIQSLNIVLRSFHKVFPDAVVFVDAFRMALVGSQHVAGASALLANLQRLSDTERDSATGGEGAWTWLGRYWGHMKVPAGPVQREWAPLIEFRLPYARYNGSLDLSRLLDYLLRNRPEVKQAATELGIGEEDYPAFERAFIGTELAHRSWLALLRQQAQQGERLLKLAYQANPKDRWVGFAVADQVMASLEAGRIANVSEQKVLESVLRIRPDHPEALKRLWRIAQNKGDKVKAQNYRMRLRAVSPLDVDVSR